MTARIALVCCLLAVLPLVFADLCTNPQAVTSQLLNFTNVGSMKSYYFVYKAPTGQKSVSVKFYPQTTQYPLDTTSIFLADRCSSSLVTQTQYLSGNSLVVLTPSSSLKTASTLYIAVNTSYSFNLQVCSSGGSSGQCTNICPNDCSGQGKCNVNTGYCTCTFMYSGTDCSICSGCATVATGAGILFGSLAICLVVLCVIPVLAVIACIVVAVSCCRSRRTHHYHTTIVPTANQYSPIPQGPYPPGGVPGSYSSAPQSYPPGAPYAPAPVNYYYAPAPGQPYSTAPPESAKV